MKRVKVDTSNIDVALYVCTMTALFSTGHLIGGAFIVIWIGFLIHVHEERNEQQKTSVKEVATIYANQDAMTPFEREVAEKAFRAGVKWQKDCK